MSDITIYHNPACGTSRNTLALIRNSGAEPQVIEYLKTPPGKERLRELIAAAAFIPRTRRATKPTRSSQKRRVDSKTLRGKVKALRGRVSDS